MRLAELVAEQHDALIADFLEKAQARLDTGGMSAVELIDSLPSFLDGLVEALAADTRSGVREIGGEHGEQRLRVGFKIDELTREYFLIAGCVLEAAQAAQVEPTLDELRRLMRAVSDGASAAAREYSRRREDDLVRREAMHAGFLAHELRNSLTSARFAFDLLRRKTLPEAHELVAVIDGSLRRASQHIDDALLGQRLRSTPISPTQTLLRRLLDDIAAELRAAADDKSIKVALTVEPDLAIEADVRLLRSALSNLMANAIKFTSRGGQVTVRAEANDERVEMLVEDQCGGLAPGTQERMFAPFAQAGNDRSGFGLGLSIARTAIEAQGGTLTVRNRPGNGCMFVLQLPRLLTTHV